MREGKSKRRNPVFVLISVFAVLLLAVVLLVVILYGVARMMMASGERNLREITIYHSMTLDTEAAAPTEESDYAWKEGWVRYQDRVYEYNENILTFLLLGIDKMEKVSPNPDQVSGGQADTIFLLVVNPDTKQLSLIGVNRDTMVDVRMVGVGSEGEDLIYQAQLAIQHGFGDGMEQSCELTRDAVSELFYQLPIHGYASFNMGGVAVLNDTLGGVDLPVMGEDMTGFRENWTEGTWLHLMGMDAFEYVHYRDPDLFESSRMRLERQKQYLAAFGQKAVEATGKDLTLPMTLYQKLKDYIVTDIGMEEIAYLAGELISYQFDSSQIYTLEGTTKKGDFEEFYPDKRALKELILNLFYREVEPGKVS